MARTRTLHTRSLHPHRGYLARETLDRQAAARASGIVLPPPIVTATDQGLVVYDGDHRTYGLVARGERRLEAEYYDLRKESDLMAFTTRQHDLHLDFICGPALPREFALRYDPYPTEPNPELIAEAEGNIAYTTSLGVRSHADLANRILESTQEMKARDHALHQEYRKRS